MLHAEKANVLPAPPNLHESKKACAELAFVGWVERSETQQNVAPSNFGGFFSMRYRRAYIPGGTFFFTVVTYRR